MIIESIAGILPAGVAIYFYGFETSTLPYILLALGAGLLEGCFSYFYFKALKVTDVPIIVVLLQAIPVFSVILGFFLFQERLSLINYLGIILIIVAGGWASYEKDENEKASILPKALILILLASLCVSISYAIEVFVLNTLSANSVFVFGRMGYLLFVILVFSFVPKVRNNFLVELPKIHIAVPLIILLLVIINLTGVYIQTVAYQEGNLSIVSVLSSMQPIFVLFMVIVLNGIRPGTIPDKGTKQHLKSRLIIVLVAMAGMILLYITSNQ